MAAGTDASVAGRVAVSPVVVRLEAVPRKPKSKGPLEVRATVTNQSRDRVEQVDLALRVTPASLTIKPPETRQVRSLGAGRSADAAWSICAVASGTFELVATATVGGVAVDSPAITVTLPAGRC